MIKFNYKYYLFLIIILALVLRINGIDTTLPYFHSDGGDLVPRSYDLVKNHSLDYKIYKYGSFYFYLNALAYWLFFIIEWARQGFGPEFSDIVNSFALNNDKGLLLFYLSKYISLIFGLLSILVTYKIAELMFNKKAGLLASFLTALDPLHINQSQLANVDICLLFCLLAGFFFSVKALGNPKIKYYILSGVFFGLALSTKYFFFPILSFLTVHYLNYRNINTFSRRLIDWKLVLFVYALAGAFIVTDPIFFLKFSEIIKRPISYVYVLNKMPLDSNIFGIQVIYQMFFTAVILNMPIVIISISNFIKLFKEKRMYFIIFMIYPGFYLLFMILLVKHPFPQYLLPVLPFISILASGYIANNELRKDGFNYFRILMLMMGIMFSLVNLFIPYYNTMSGFQKGLGEWIKNKTQSGNSVFLPKMLFVPTSVILNDPLIKYYDLPDYGFKINYEKENIFNKIENQRMNLESLNPLMVIVLNPDYIISYDANYLHMKYYSSLYKSGVYFQTMEKLKAGNFNYELCENIKPPRIYMRLAGMLIPQMRDFQYMVFKKTKSYGIDEKLRYLKDHLQKNKSTVNENQYLKILIDDLPRNEREEILKDLSYDH